MLALVGQQVVGRRELLDDLKLDAVLSRISRRAAASSVSPNSTPPPGVSQQPASLLAPSERSDRNSSPRALKSITPTDTPM